MDGKTQEMVGRKTGRASRLRALAAVVVVAVFGSVLALLAPGAPTAKAAAGDLQFQGCNSDKLLPGATCLAGGRVDGPDGVVMSPDGKFLYTWSTASSTGGSITTFQVADNGSLTDVDCIGSETLCKRPGSANIGLVYDVIISPDGRFAYVADPGYRILVFVRNVVTGSLTFSSCVRDPRFSNDTACTPVPFLNNPGDLAIDENTKSLYVASLNAPGGVVRFERNLTDGTLTFRQCVTGSSQKGCSAAPGLNDSHVVAVGSNGFAVYVGSRANLVTLRLVNGVLTFVDCFGNKKSDVDPESGAAQCTKIPGLTYTTDIAISPDGGSLFVTSTGSDAVVHFVRSSTGALAMRDCYRDVRRPATGCLGVVYIASPSSVDVAPDGKTVFVTGAESGSLIPFFSDLSNGGLGGGPRLAQPTCILDNSNPGLGCARAEGIGGAQDVVVSPGEKYVYVAGGEGAIARFEREGSICQFNPKACQFGATAPDTTIDSAPEPVSRSSTPTFSFSATEDATFECSLDGADFEACSSPLTYTGMAKGAHFVGIVATNLAGVRDETPATYKWTIKRKRVRR